MKEKKENPQITQIAQIFCTLSVGFVKESDSIISLRSKAGDRP